MARFQRTIGKATEVAGTATFSGRAVRARLLPAEPGTGYLFLRTDLPDSPVVPGTAEAVSEGFRCTTLNWNDVEVQAVEHVLAACAGLRIDNLIIELDGPELPAMGGCAAEFARVLQAAGAVEQNDERPTLTVTEPLSVHEGEASIVAMPNSDRLSASYVLNLADGYGHTQAFTADISPETFLRELAPARTFGLEDDYQEFEKLSLGGGIDDGNAFVLCRGGAVRTPLSRRDTQMRFPEEAARHKLVDLLGDLALAGLDLEARVLAFRSGHRLNALFAQRLRSQLEGETAPAQYMDIGEIRRILPHRYPFLMVDRVLQVEGDSKVLAVKNVSVNEPFFQGHYPNQPIMPGVLQLEALAQAAGVLFLRRLEHANKVPMLVGLDSVKLRRPVLPGDQLQLEAEALRFRSRLAMVRGRATVNGEVTCEAEMTFMLADADAI